LYLFIRGLLLLARQRLLVHTPTTKIGNVSSGLVEVSGTATGTMTQRAPITGENCLFYQTRARSLNQSQKNATWETIADDVTHTPFVLSDDTGKILIDPEGTELDLSKNFCEEFNISAFSTNDELPSEADSFLAHFGVIPRGRIRIEEWTLIPNQPLFIVGTAMENLGISSPQPATAENGSPDPSVSPERLPQSPAETIRLSQANAPAVSSEMTLQGKIAAALVKAGMQNEEVWESPAALDAALPDQSAPQLSKLLVSATPSIKVQSDGPKLVLRKGTDNPMFLISSRSRQDVVRSLAWKSFAMIWGGIWLLVVGGYILLL
jgi:hypothetical protein